LVSLVARTAPTPHKIMAAPGPRLQLAGERQTGQDVRTQNVTAVSAIANIVKSSLGPVGLDKVLECYKCG
jgi:hypothetical protein